MNNPFTIGRIYKRSQIHNKYRGQEQGGISTPSNFPFIFIFSVKAGQLHGYKDRWENPDVFSYTGEGQKNDMKFIRGNLALRDHIKNGKRVFLFTEDVRSHVKFEGEVILLEIGFYEDVDRNKNNRIAFKFFFKRIESRLDYSIDDLFSLTTGMIKESTFTPPTETERKGLVTSRVGQGAYRRSILYRWEFKCAVSNYTKNEILIASHIIPWKDSTNDQRLDVNNGILLSPNYDALFDKHLISFENSGKIILSDTLSKTNYKDLGVTGKEIIKKFNSDNHFYLERHREIIQ